VVLTSTIQEAASQSNIIVPDTRHGIALQYTMSWSTVTAIYFVCLYKLNVHMWHAHARQFSFKEGLLLHKSSDVHLFSHPQFGDASHTFGALG
jgi:hypothetical protein